MNFEALRHHEGFSPSSPIANEFSELLSRGLVHKMNNLLTVFHGYSSMMAADTKLTESTRDFAREIKTAADSTSTLLSRLATVAQPPALELGTLNLGEFFDHHQSVLNRLVVPPSILELAIDPAHTLTTDRATLAQIITALTTNASQALEGEGVVRIESVEEGRQLPSRTGGASVDGLTLLILDNGRGVSAEHFTKIFEPFFSLRKELGSLGLGLAAARQWIRALGGTIAIASIPGDGTCIRLVLPIADSIA